MEKHLIEKISKEAGLTQEEKELLIELEKLPSVRDIIGDAIYNLTPEQETELYRKFIFNEEFIARAKKSNLIMAIAGIVILFTFLLFMGLTDWRSLLPKDNELGFIIMALWVMTGAILTYAGVVDYRGHLKTEKVLKKIKEIGKRSKIKL